MKIGSIQQVKSLKLLCLVAITMLSGCSNLPWSEQVRDVREKQGLLACDEQRFCPSVRILPQYSNLTTVVLEVKITSENHHYEIQRVSFDNQQQLLNYMPMRPAYRTVNKGLYHSFVNISIPANLMQQLAGERIAIDIHTDRGKVRRYLYDHGQQAKLYQDLEQRRQLR